ncbi:hypothetical protein HMSSN036_25610 [Paenibacillus macerans]|nr:hypothetical protein HMSSN036_25610 [Paenibacillus macerans]
MGNLDADDHQIHVFGPHQFPIVVKSLGDPNAAALSLADAIFEVAMAVISWHVLWVRAGI